MGLYGAAVFLSAALLFQIQLVIGKRILPWFGGTAAVWTTAMVVFQVLLLLGYAYADAVVTRLAPRRQAQLHGALLVASLVALPAVSSGGLRDGGTGDPALQVVLLLLATVGLPFFTLGSTTPLVSAWYATRPGARPYRLYALSNAGSMTGLVSYPFVVEPYLGTRQQSLLWSTLYVVVVVLVGCAAVRVRNARTVIAAVESTPRRTADALSRALWLLLPACSSAALLAVTAHLTQNVAPVPLLWVAALAVYLLTFIVAFARTRVPYSRRVVLPLALATVATLAVSTSGGGGGGVAREIVLFLAGLFLACFALHGELAALKPEAAGLTAYYLAISLGGALGSTAFAVVAPLVLPAAADLPVALVAVFATLAGVAIRRVNPTNRGTNPRRRLALAAVAVLLAATVTWQLRAELSGARRSERNFYGSLAVADEGPSGDRNEFRDLRHGVVDHGGQFVAKNRRGEATGYYYPATGVGRLLEVRDGPGHVPARDRARRVAVVGLGAGTLLSYSRPGEEWVVFEINPRVTELARSEFTFLGDAKARIEVRHGDGRLELARDRGGKFDAIVIDAFSGDAVPVHLLTDEAFALYLDRLKPDGVLALHITNKHLDFAPVLQNLAAAHKRPALLVETRGPRERLYDARWVLVANDVSLFERPPWRGAGTLLPAASNPRVSRWTDDYSNILAVLR